MSPLLCLAEGWHGPAPALRRAHTCRPALCATGSRGPQPRVPRPALVGHCAPYPGLTVGPPARGAWPVSCPGPGPHAFAPPRHAPRCQNRAPGISNGELCVCGTCAGPCSAGCCALAAPAPTSARHPRQQRREFCGAGVAGFPNWQRSAFHRSAQWTVPQCSGGSIRTDHISSV